MTLTTRTPILPCGKRFGSKDEAAHHKLALAGTHSPIPCNYGCRGWHLERIQAPSAPARAAPKDTGPSAKVRAIVLERDGYRCLRCGRPCGPGIGPYSIQHRKARGVGGDNSLCNLILLDGTATTGCHGAVESRRDPHDQAAGWRLESWEDPARCGVLVVSAGGGGVLVWLEPDGGLLFEPPAGAA